MLCKYKFLFSYKTSSAGNYVHEIKLITNKPFVKRSYPIPMSLRPAVDEEIQNMLDSGIIERSFSPYCNPLHIVKKKDGKVRICLDARHLNSISESDNEAPPLIGELLQKYHGRNFMTITDLANGYWQIALAKQSRPYTAFLHGSTMYQFCRIPFGLKTAGSGFIRALDLTLGRKFDSFLTRYIDDLLITSKSFEEHLNHIELIFSVLQENNFTLRLDKSLFCRDSVSFLGFVLSVEGVQPDPNKLDIIRNFASPSNKKELQQFLGMCNYYRQFSVAHSNLVHPFRNLLKKNAMWQWTSEHDEAFQALKDNFIKIVRLHHIIPGSTFKVQTDASNKGISGILYQTDTQGNNHIISLVSRCLSSPECNYTTTEKELLAVVYSITKFRVYLLGNTFEIITDHKSLTFLNNTMYQTARLIRWSLLLQQYSFTVKHCSGRDNIVADFFSRNPNGKFESDSRNDQLIISEIISVDIGKNCDGLMATRALAKLIDEDKALYKEFKNFPVLQKNDLKISKLLCKYERGELRENFTINDQILFNKDRMTNRWRVCVPLNMVRKLIESIHVKIGHPGVYKTLCYINRFYFWNGMNRDVKKYVTTCDLCQRTKTLTVNMQGEYQFVKSTRPNQLVTVDFYGPLPTSVGGVQYLFVLLDAYSKYVKLYAIKRANTRIVVKRLVENYIPEVGKPEVVLSDNGTQFTSPIWRNELEKRGIKTIYSSVRHPQSNPTERVMKELGRFFRTYCSQSHTSWAKYIKKIEHLLNITTHHSTGFAPIEVHFGISPSDEIQKYIQFPEQNEISHETKLLLANERLLDNFEKRRKGQIKKSNVVLNKGDLVLLKVPHLSNALDRLTHKFFHLYEGPYKIYDIIGKNACRLQDPHNDNLLKGTHNRIHLRKYYPPTDVSKR